jgi:hypothetical protein
VADVSVGESDVRSMVVPGKEMPIDDRNERSLSYWFEIEKIRQPLHQVSREFAYFLGVGR